MVLHILRALFVLLMGAAGWFFFVADPVQPRSGDALIALWITLSIAVFFVCIDILLPRQKVLIFSGTFLGLLVGMLISYGLSYVIFLIVDLFFPGLALEQKVKIIKFTTLIVGILCCYLSISFVLQTRDDFRFIVPYVEFAKQVRGARPLVVDTSVIIDGRILDLVETGLIDSRLIVPRFVVLELQLIADNGEKLKRNRGRRGLDILTKLQGNKKAEVIIYDWTGHSSPEAQDTDQKLLVLAKELNGRVLTNDSNLSKVAQVRGVDVINMNEVANALRPVVLPGEKLIVRLVKPGEDPSQGIGFLEDGTMVVVKDGRGHLNEEVEFSVTNVLQTATGRMIFGQIGDNAAIAQRRPPRQRTDSPSART
ncbi:MAG TPA: PIN domain-containing protein [Tepidisphaeraceae bacterium]|jgi:uncharacterized protein YacL|nr:PIN domain-containing protein [Tepidisphaeraceae bacterium]